MINTKNFFFKTAKAEKSNPVSSGNPVSFGNMRSGVGKLAIMASLLTASSLMTGMTTITRAAAQTVAVMDGQVHTVTGSIIEGGDIIIRDGKITEVGANLSAPAGATIIDATGKFVTPGIIAPHSTLGLSEVGAVADSNDTRPNNNFPLGASLDAADGFNPASSLIAINRAGGVTRAVSVPSAGGSLFGGQSILVDLTGKNNSLIKRSVSQSVLIGGGGTGRAGGTKLGVWAILRETLAEAQTYANNPAGYRQLSSDGRYKVSDLAALRPVIEGRQPLLVSVDRAADIRNVIRLKNDYGLKIVIVSGREAWREARALAAANIPVILDPLANLPSDFDTIGSTLKNAAFLNQAGVVIGFYGPQSGTHNLRLLPQLAGNAVAEGLPYDAALKALTLNPAKIYGIDTDLGTIEVGKIADIVVWDGDPLEITTRVSDVVINGVAQSLDNRQQHLLERYKDLDRGDKPHPFRGGN